MSKQRIFWRALVYSLLVLLAIPFLMYFTRVEATTGPSQIEEVLAKMPVGVSIQEVDTLMGSKPDGVSQAQAIIGNPSLVYAPSNPQGQKFGKPQTYSFRTWVREGVNATVVFDEEGKVVAKTADHVE